MVVFGKWSFFFGKNLTILDPFEESHPGRIAVKIDADSDLMSTDDNLPIIVYRFGPPKIFRHQK
jgi:hypothetical protein